MSFTLASFVPLSAMANSEVPRYFLYKTDDLIAAVKAADYFLNQFSILNPDDIIVIWADDDGNASRFDLVVTAASSSTVTTQLLTNQELAASGAVNAVVGSIELNHATVIVEATIADTKAHQGLFVIKDTSASGTAAHTLTCTVGTLDGSNTIATLDAPNECLVVWFDSAGDGTIVENIGSVALS